jgi:hypothetical protein
MASENGADLNWSEEVSGFHRHHHHHNSHHLKTSAKIFITLLKLRSPEFGHISGHAHKHKTLQTFQN